MRGKKHQRNPGGLTPAEEAFAQAWVKRSAVNGSATDAWLDAHPGTKANRKTAGRRAHDLLLKPHVAARVEVLRQAAVEQTIATVRETLENCCAIGYFDFGDIFDDASNVLPVKQWPRRARLACAGMGYDKRGMPTYRFHGKGDVIGTLFRHHGLFKQDNDQLTDPVAELLRAINATSTAGLTVRP